MNFSFMGGSLGMAAGESIILAIEVKKKGGGWRLSTALKKKNDLSKSQ